jgi:ubiquinone/menaquinone biosynthesis C-methylase UbiE
MQTSEYSNLDRVERDHWFYAGKRALVEHWIRAARPLAATDTLLDFGAGTGRFASGFLGVCQVKVFDSYPESLAILRTRFSPEAILAPAGAGIPLPDSAIDCLTALDVIEHLADDKAIVREFHRVLRSSGLVVITVPADMKLWSDWDVSLFHQRRYDRRGLLALFDPRQWELVRCTYTNAFAYPAVYLVRKWRKWTRAGSKDAHRAEDRVPAPWLNRLLRFLYVFPARTSWFPAPFGVNLLLVARKR